MSGKLKIIDCHNMRKFSFQIEKLIIDGLLILFAISFLACDSAMLLRGRVVKNHNVSGRVVNLSGIDSLDYIEDAKISFYSWIRDDFGFGLFVKPRGEFLSDSAGYFSEAFTANPRSASRFAAIIASKDGFTNDTVFFEYKSLDTINVILNLKKIND